MLPTLVARSTVLLALLTSAAPAQQSVPGLRLPPGFEVVEFADSSVANDIFTMTLDPKGRVVVAGRGYLRILLDKDGDGKADGFLTVADAPKEGAMGLLWEGKHLYCIGDGGLRRFTDADGDGKADGPSELLHRLKTGGEHDAHAIRRGPDGWLYVLCGNHADVDKLVKPAATSPIKKPVAGVVLRFSPDFKTVEIVAHGFRNPYDMDFNSDGELFTFDSDNERCVSLPWYEPTRFYHVRPGAHHGWLSPQRASFWRLPPYYSDVSAPVCTLGRGSPTGCICYRHGQFPEKYRGGFFLCDWTFGQIHFVTLKKSEKTYTGTSEVFLRSTGDNGFAPTAAAVHPETGDLFVSIGGRGTRGGVYRIRYPAGLQEAQRGAKHWEMAQRPMRATAAPLASPSFQPVREQSDEYRREVFDLTDGVKGTHHDRVLANVRRLQIMLGDEMAGADRGTVWEGYARKRLSDDWPHVQQIRTSVRYLFPSRDPRVNRELARLFAILEDDTERILDKIAQRLQPTSDPVEDIHYLIVFARLRAARSRDLTDKIASTLLELDAKITGAKLNRDSHWPLRMAELHRELARKDPALNDVLLAHKDFGRPDHVLWTKAPGFDRNKAAALFLSRAAKDANFTWNAGLVQLIGELPDEQALPALRKLWDQVGLNDLILPLLARRPAAEDQANFLAGLTSPSLSVVRQSLAAVEKLSLNKDAATLRALVQGMRLLPDGKEEDKTRAEIGKLLRRLTGQSLAEGDKQAWEAWLRKTHPLEAAKLGGDDGVDAAAWTKRLAGIDWATGDKTRGQAVFMKASCAACHSGSQAMGPDLAGVAGRFSRADLFTAIVRPSKDVSARYRTTVITTEDAKLYQGLIVYEAVDSVILQTGPATTVRLAHQQISAKRLSPLSLMPVGLLDRLGDRDLADLYVYLKSLTSTSASGK